MTRLILALILAQGLVYPQDKPLISHETMGYTEAEYQRGVQRAADLTVQEEELALKLNTGKIGPKEYYPAFSKVRPQITDLYNIYGRGDMNEKFRADIAAASILRIQQLKRQYAPPPKVQQAKPRPKIIRDPPDTSVPDSYRWKQVGFGIVAFGFAYWAFFALVHRFFPTGPRAEESGPVVSTNYGSATFSNFIYGLPNKGYVSRGVFFGKSSHPDADSMPVMEQPGAPLCSQPSHHTLIVARTRTGKGTRVIVPTLLKYGGSALVIDPKGENAAITAGARKAMYQHANVHIVNPWGELAKHFQKLGFPPATFNPLDALDRLDPDAVAMAQELANTICPPLSGKDQFWQGSAAGLLTGIMLYLLDTPGETLTLARVREIVTSSRKELTDQYLLKMAASTAFQGAVREFASAFVDMASDTFSGIVANAVENTRFLSDPQVKLATATSSFNFIDLVMSDPTTVYLVIPPQRIATQRTWLRLVITAMTGMFKRVPMGKRPGHRCMFLIDEFPALGRMPDIPTDIATMAGYGVDYTLVVQGLDQLKDHYKEGAATILSNCAFKWFCNVNDLESAKYLSDTLGKATVQTIGRGESHGDNPGGATAGESVNYGETGRSLLNPDEVLTLGRDTAIVLHPESKPHYVRPVDYWNLQTAFAHMKVKEPQMFWNPPLQFDDNPYFQPERSDD